MSVFTGVIVYLLIWWLALWWVIESEWLSFRTGILAMPTN